MKLTMNFVHNGVEVMENQGHGTDQNLVFEDADHLAMWVHHRFVKYFGGSSNLLCLDESAQPEEKPE